MKAFEEYKEKKFGVKNIEPDCSEAEVYLKGLEEGYKAALEWAYKKCEELDESSCMDCFCFYAVQDKIDEELEQQHKGAKDENITTRNLQ